jgi:AbiV family abortive infection protein
LFPIPYQKLVEGATLCRDNAAMLSECALDIFEKYPSISSFLTVLAIEETGKGLALLKKYEKGDDFKEKEWKKLTEDRKAHRRKLKIVHTALVDPYSVLSPHKLSVKIEEIKEFQHKANIIAKQVNKLKLDYLYVNWNEKQNRWMLPMKDHIFVEHIFQRLVASIRILSQKLREGN